MEGAYLGEAGRSAGRVSEVEKRGSGRWKQLQEKRSEAEERNATDGFYVYRTYIFLLVLFAAFAERNLKCRKFRRDVSGGIGAFLYRQAGVCVRPVIHASGKQRILHYIVSRCIMLMRKGIGFRYGISDNYYKL